MDILLQINIISFILVYPSEENPEQFLWYDLGMNVRDFQVPIPRLTFHYVAWVTLTVLRNCTENRKIIQNQHLTRSEWMHIE